MTTTAPTTVQDFSRSAYDRHRYERRARVRVKVRPARLQIHGHLIPNDGREHDILVPKSMVPELQQMVADPAKLKAAEEHFQSEHADWCRENSEQTSPFSPARSYRTIWRADVPPLESFEVIEEDVDPPLTEEDRRAAAIARSAARGTGRSKRGS